MGKKMRFFITSAAAFLTGIGCACSFFNSVSPLPYTPVVTFAGIVNNDSLFYPGNRSYPNTCVALDSCIRMFFYSEDYSQGETYQGDRMRLDVFLPDTQFITNRHALFNYVRYTRPIATPTYNISVVDTISDYNTIHIRAKTFERRSGGEVLLTDMSVIARSLGQFASEPLEIRRGVIRGHVE
jgi:hypothetical protein